MTINENKKRIELSKEEMKKAMVVGSFEYNTLQAARRDYPGFHTFELKPNRKKADFAGLDMKTIRQYVEKNGSEEQKKNFAFISKRTVDAEGNYAEPQPFFEIKKWFLNEFPDLKKQRLEYRKTVIEIFHAAEEKAAS